MNHTIEVSFVGTRVHAEPNPLPTRGNTQQPPQTVISPGDTITWDWSQAAPGRNLQVVFVEMGLLEQDGSVGSNQPVDPLGPLSRLSLGANLIEGTVHSNVPQNVSQAQRFFYRIFENGNPLVWDNPVPGKSDPRMNGGGIDIPNTPP